MPAFSVIVPIYNAEKTLVRCLDSLRAQTEPDFEILMVENGSTDGSNAICRAFAEGDDRFVLLEMPAAWGPSGARNAGLDRAAGEWVAFVDSDDHVEPVFLERLRCRFAQTGAGAVFFGCRRYSAGGALLGECIPTGSSSAGADLWTELYRQELFGYTWSKAFRRDAIGGCRFSLALDLLEDEVFTCEVLAQGCRTAVLEEPLYKYTAGNPGSLMGRTHPDYCRKEDAAHRVWKALLAEEPGAATVLTEQANGRVRRCMYYGFERDVEPEAFFRELAETEFFRDCTLEDGFCGGVRSGRWAALRLARRSYRIRQIAARLLGKREKPWNNGKK